MTVDYQQMIDELTEEYEKAKVRTGELRRKLGELTASATAQREAVKVTVGAQGDVRSIEFPNGAYKRMAPAELSAALMTTINEAKDKAQTMLSELMAPSLPAGANFLDILQGKADASASAGTGPGMPGIVRDHLASDSATEDRGQSE